MIVSLIAIMDKGRGLGFENKLSWHLPDDLKRFKATTKGHAIIMGRKTFESIGRPLPDRKNIIITRNANYSAPGCIVAHSIEEALKEARDESEVFIIGGAEIYTLSLPYANKMYLTFVDAEIPADAYFPEFNEGEWNVVAIKTHGKDEKHPYEFSYKEYEKK